MDNSNYAPPHWSHWENAFFTNYVEEDTALTYEGIASRVRSTEPAAANNDKRDGDKV